MESSGSGKGSVRGSIRKFVFGAGRWGRGKRSALGDEPSAKWNVRLARLIRPDMQAVSALSKVERASRPFASEVDGLSGSRLLKMAMQSVVTKAKSRQGFRVSSADPMAGHEAARTMTCET